MSTESEGCIAVLDVGKSNVKLSAVSRSGHVLESASTRNLVRDGPPWRHHDLESLSEWVFSQLSALCRAHDIRHIVPVGHGSGGVLTGDDPDAAAGGAVLPMVDYEQPFPPGLNDRYRPLSGGFFDRGSAIMQASTHQARQLFLMQQQRPEDFVRARWFLGLPQYWAWRLSGVAACEHSYLGAQTHLWNVVDQKFTAIVAGQGWQHLMPPFAAAWQVLGPVRENLVRRYSLPSGLKVHAGAHDSSVNFYRYQAAGHSGLGVVSTGTWIVALADQPDLSSLDETRGMTCNSDVYGQALGGALTMGGREFGFVAGEQDALSPVDPELMASLIERGTMAIPAFGEDSGQFPGCAGQGHILGPAPEHAAGRRALGILYMALLTSACADTLVKGGRLVLDGSFLRDPLYAGLVAGLRPEAETFFNLESYGVAAGAALLCGHETRRVPAPVRLNRALCPPRIRGLAEYGQTWLAHANSRGLTLQKG